MQDMMIHLMNQYGYIGILLLIAVENIFPPIPSEVILTFGGFMAAYSHLNLWGVIAAATAGSVLGAMAVYKAGSFFNADRLSKLTDSRPARVLHLKRSDISRANGWFSRFGYKAVFLCRCVPLVRSLISLPAGMARMRYIPFLLLTTAGSLIWNTALIWFGAAAGESWGMIIKYTDIYTSVAAAVLGLATLVLGAVYIKKRFFSNKNTSADISEDNLYSSETR